MGDDIVTILPEEIVEYILEDECIRFIDVVNFGSTCKHLHKIVSHNNKLWNLKFFQRWPFLKEIYQEIGRLDGRVSNWKDETRASLIIRQKLFYFLSLMSHNNYEKPDLSSSDFQDFDALISPEEGAHPLAYYFLIDELMTLIKSARMNDNLTHKYYAFKVLRHLKQNHVQKLWEKFTSLPRRKQVLEYGAALVAEWSQPVRHVPYSYISGLLDTIAEQAKELLKEQYPSHSMFSISEEQFTYWKHNNIDDNQWSIIETRQVIDALCKALFQKLECYGNNEMHYLYENYLIDRVLENGRGIPITLAIIFESVARRLGIRCEPVSFPSHFLLRWKESYTSPEAQQTENFYIDVLDGGRFLTKKNCPRIGGIQRCPIEKYNVYEPATAVEVAIRIANNLAVAARQVNHLNGRLARLRSAVELQHMIEPNNKDILVQLGHYYLTNGIDLQGLMKKFESADKASDETRGQAFLTIIGFHQGLHSKAIRQVKERSPALKYAIGLIMRNETDRYTCVIRGWDLKGGDRSDQPIYDVLVNDGSAVYVAQDNLCLASFPHWINHYEIGRHFEKFCETHYLPNEESAWEYSQDEEVRNKLLLTYENATYVN